MYDVTATDTDKPSHGHRSLEEMVSRLGIPQPQYGRDCTLALWNPLTNSFQWVAVDCHEDVFVSAVVCYVNEGLEQTEGPIISYIEDEAQDFKKADFVERLYDQYVGHILTIHLGIAGFSCREFKFVSSYMGDSFTHILYMTDYHKMALLQKSKLLIGKDCVNGKVDTPVVALSFQYISSNDTSKISDIGSHIVSNYLVRHGTKCTSISVLILYVCIKFHLEPLQSDDGAMEHNTDVLTEVHDFLQRFKQFRLIPITAKGTSRIPVYNGWQNLFVEISQAINEVELSLKCSIGQYTCTDGHCIAEGFVLDGKT